MKKKNKANTIIYLATNERIKVNDLRSVVEAYMVGPNRLVSFKRVTDHGTTKRFTIPSQLLVRAEET